VQYHEGGIERDGVRCALGRVSLVLILYHESCQYQRGLIQSSHVRWLEVGIFVCQKPSIVRPRVRYYRYVQKRMVDMYYAEVSVAH
jgi:hypothetical protein